MLTPDDIDRSDPHVALWCSGIRRGLKCAHGHLAHAIACMPHTLRQAEEYVPACCTDSGKCERASGTPIRFGAHR